MTYFKPWGKSSLIFCLSFNVWTSLDSLRIEANKLNLGASDFARTADEVSRAETYAKNRRMDTTFQTLRESIDSAVEYDAIRRILGGTRRRTDEWFQNNPGFVSFFRFGRKTPKKHFILKGFRASLVVRAKITHNWQYKHLLQWRKGCVC